ncbi:lysozyme inhibitor LprI family protein [Cellvibrio sp. BR]|uniref:lysozyme inhibitor LprI family protein n=1 Tax=Cellvibrio sp. BR TaxID=1134474 RepID=UPI00058FCDE4|nr:lysozyme inhibitor LprI family protein [Cellvibrio sp. BR]
MKYYVFAIAIFSMGVSASECFDEPSTIQRAQCHGKEVAKLDVQLNLEYKYAISQLKKNPRVTVEEFRAAQGLWVKFIEADCQVKGKLYGGAPAWQTVEYQMCRKEYYEKQILLFKVTSHKAAP